MGGADKR